MSTITEKINLKKIKESHILKKEPASRCYTNTPHPSIKFFFKLFIKYLKFFSLKKKIFFQTLNVKFTHDMFT